MSHSENDKYDCIGGEGWYHVCFRSYLFYFQERCSSNFLITVPQRVFADLPPLAAPFREDLCIHLGNEQRFRLPEDERKECTFCFVLLF